MVENCVVDCCQSGSVSATESTHVAIGTAIGIFIAGGLTIKPQVVIDGCTVCNINGGDATLLNGTFTLLSDPNTFVSVGGIATPFIDSACLRNNKVSGIHRGAVELGGLNSSTELDFVAGILASAKTTIAENNTVSHVTCKKVTASGICTTINESVDPFFFPCFGNLASPFVEELSPICSGMLITGSTITQICNNTVTSIDAGKRIANGE
ncbi:unnamed protein product, partial [marine sediment metagenome]